MGHRAIGLCKQRWSLPEGTRYGDFPATPEDADSPYNLIIPPLYATLW